MRRGHRRPTYGPPEQAAKSWSDGGVRRSIDDHPFTPRRAAAQRGGHPAPVVGGRHQRRLRRRRAPVVLTVEEVGNAGAGLIAHLTPTIARRLRVALRDALERSAENGRRSREDGGPTLRGAAVPAARPPGAPGPPPRAAARGRPAADREGGRRSGGDQPEHRAQGVPRARARGPRRRSPGLGTFVTRSLADESVAAHKGAAGRARPVAGARPGEPGSTTPASSALFESTFHASSDEGVA